MQEVREKPLVPLIESNELVTEIDTLGTAVDKPSSVLTADDPALPPSDLWQRIRQGLRWEPAERASIEKARKQYLRQSTYLNTIARRANYYLFYIVEEVERRGLPMELVFLPMVESTLSPFAASGSKAAGLWQIMPATGKHLGLRQDWWFDGRRDLRDSTHAALDYLESLHSDFDGDWVLALAAYNSGKSRVRRAQRANARQGRSTDFWSLKLPRETRDYVPRIIALSQIVRIPEQFGAVIPSVANQASFEVAATGGQIELVRAAELAGVDIDTLRAYNPGHLRWASSPDVAQELLLPSGSRTKFERGIATLASEDRVRWQYYAIERGDTLGDIAQNFGIKVSLLKQANSLRTSRIRAGDTLLIPSGDSGWSDSLAMAAKSKKPKGYRVRAGDSLYRIAGRFNISIRDIVAWNDLDPSKYLQPGQKLTLYVSGG